MKARQSILVLQHATCEPIAAYGDELHDRGIATCVVELDKGERLPSPEGFDAVIAMGGPMSVNDEASFPWLVEEKLLIRDHVRAQRPFWGVCLGAQLLAASLAARVYEGPDPEVGILPVWTQGPAQLDPVFSSLESEFLALQWHSDTFELPEGSVLLASSPAYRHQAFRWARAYGVQFHLEVSPRLIRQWGDIPEYADALRGAMGKDGLPRLIARLSEVEDSMRSHALGLFRGWLDLLATTKPSGRP